MQHLGGPMSDIHWHSIEIDSNDEIQEIGHSLDTTASELHFQILQQKILMKNSYKQRVK